MRDLRVLVVDDSKVGRVTLVRKLEPLGVRVDTVESGQQALDFLANTRPDLILMDHMMPDMDGFEVTRRIKAAQATRDIPVVIVSGNDEAEFVREARDAGAIDAIAKPPAPGVLEAILASIAKPVPAPEPAPAPQPTVDLATLRAVVDELLGKAMEGLRSEIKAHADARMETASAKQQAMLKEADDSWHLRTDQLAARVEALRGEAVEAAALGARLDTLEQRLLPLEAQAGQPVPDFEPARRALQAGLDDLHTRGEQRAGALDSRCDALSADLGRLSGDLQSNRTELARRVDEIGQRLSRIEAVPASGADVESLLTAMDERVARRFAQMEERLDKQATGLDTQSRRQDAAHQSLNAALGELATRLDALHAQVEALGGPSAAESEFQARCDALEHRLDDLAAFQPAAPSYTDQNEADSDRLADIRAEIADLREHLSEARLRELVAEAIGQMQPIAPMAVDVETPRLPQPEAGGDGRLQADMDRLKAKVKALTFMVAAGGAVLLAVIVMLVFGG